jgi:flagellar L-ring protein precursor FlgH
MKQSKPIRIITALTASACLLSGCGAGERLANVGKAPDQSPIVNPTQTAGYIPVSMPMPAPKAVTRQANSLWAGNNKGIFKDQRAAEVGDLITVVIAVDDKAELSNETTRTRAAGEDVGVDNLLGYESSLNEVLPEAVNPGSLINLDSQSTHRGAGEVDREEEVELQLAATVTQKLPNGNMVIQGSQEMRVNFENRVVQLSGIIRPADISVNNTIPYERIAEARIAYGGKGQLTDVQQPRYGQQVTDILMPF